MTVGISGVVQAWKVPRIMTLSQSRFGMRELKNLSIKWIIYKKMKFIKTILISHLFLMLKSRRLLFWLYAIKFSDILF